MHLQKDKRGQMEITEIKRKGKSELYYVYANGELVGLIQA